MKRKLLITAIISFIFIFAGCAGLTTRAQVPLERGYHQDLGDPADVPLLKGVNDNSKVEKELTGLREDIQNLTNAILVDKKRPAEKNCGKLPTKLPTENIEKPKAKTKIEILAKKKIVPTMSRHENRKLKDRVADLEEIVYYYHPNSDILSVKYKVGSGLLSTEEKINIKKLYEEEWLEGKCDFDAFYSYASKTKPKPPLTNMQVSQLRLQEMINFLIELGFPKNEFKMTENRGPTDRWNYNMKVTIKVTRIKDPAEIDKRKEERKQYAPPSKNQP
ncbi:hypothetical protein KAR28_03100 [Candidatus Parcubacteria bacterium]|nr:hypothetical protein [Candidatus Parcubacteria bacterium]